MSRLKYPQFRNVYQFAAANLRLVGDDGLRVPGAQFYDWYLRWVREHRAILGAWNRPVTESQFWKAMHDHFDGRLIKKPGHTHSGSTTQLVFNLSVRGRA